MLISKSTRHDKQDSYSSEKAGYRLKIEDKDSLS